MRLLRATLLPMLLVALLTPGASAKGVKTAHEAGVDYSAYPTFDWRPGHKGHPDAPLAEGSPLDRQLRSIGEKLLRAAGFEKSVSGEPDLWITFYGMLEDIGAVGGVNFELSEHVSWIGDPGSHYAHFYQQGTLVVEVVDAASDEVLWRGWASETIKKPSQLEKKAEKVMSRILKQFPPR